MYQQRACLLPRLDSFVTGGCERAPFPRSAPRAPSYSIPPQMGYKWPLQTVHASYSMLMTFWTLPLPSLGLSTLSHPSDETNWLLVPHTQKNSHAATVSFLWISLLLQLCPHDHAYPPGHLLTLQLCWLPTRKCRSAVTFMGSRTSYSSVTKQALHFSRAGNESSSSVRACYPHKSHHGACFSVTA